MKQLSIFNLGCEKPYKIKKPIRLIELFGGIGSQAKALENLQANFTHYRLCEFDKFSVQSYNAVHGTNFKTSDITKITADDLGITDTDKYEYIMTYSFPCFTADSLVLTQNGYRNIDEIIVGDKVLTHTNNYENVTKVFNNGISDIYSIRGMGIDEIKATINHKFYVREMYRKGHFNIRTFTEPRWKEVKDLTQKDYLGIAINQNSIVPNWNGIGFKWSDGRKTRYKNQLSELMGIKDFWWIIGRYIGDGWIRSQGGIIICCAKSETKDVISRVSKFFNYSISEERTVNKIHISLKELELFVSQFGRGAKNKCLTNTIIDLPINLLKEFLDGYWSADGCFTNEVFKASSVSRKLIYGMAQCVAKVYKTPYRIYENIRKPKRIIEGRSINQNTSYELVFKKDKRKQDKAFYENGYIWYPIQSIKYLGKENVYDIEVEKDHSFTIQNTIVHNCQDLSLAGKRAGMTKGSNTRSGLLWEVERLLDECVELPQVLLMENVPQVLNSDFGGWLEYLESKGYKNYYKVLNAKNFGIPQNRKRCFMVSVLGNYCYEFPKEVPLKLRLKDMLESNVDEKYYLSQKTINRISNWKAQQDPLKDIDKEKIICPTLTARGAGEDHSGMVLINENIFKNNEIVDHLSSKNFWSSYEGKDIVPTIKTNNHLGVVEKPEKNLKEQLVDKLIAQDLVRENDVIKHSYSTSRMKDDNRPRIEMNNISPTLDTRCDCLGVVVKEECITLPENTKSGYVEAYEGDGVYINRPHQKRGVVQDQMIQTLKTNVDDLGVVVKKNERVSKETSQTLTVTSSTSLAVKEPSLRIRKLIPKECWRLMGFTDSDFDKAQSAGVSNSQLYKQAGNSIVVNVLEAIFKKLF